MKMRLLLCLALAGLVSAGDDSTVRNRNRNAPKNWGDRDSPDSMDTNYCCMTHHPLKVTTKLEEYLKTTETNQWIEAARAKYDSFSCEYRDGWSYCCPDGGSPNVLGRALCACQKDDSPDDDWYAGKPDDSVDVVKQDCDSVDDWMTELIKARFDHSADSEWSPDNGRCAEKEKDACGCCPDFGWDSDEYNCEYKEDTDRNDKRFCKAFDTDPTPSDSEDGLVKDELLDECGCLPSWGWSSSEDACEPDEYTTPGEIVGCKTFLDDSAWDDWVPLPHTIKPIWGIKDDDSDDDGWTGRLRLRRRLLALDDDRNDSGNGRRNELRDECGCIQGKQGWDDGRCRNNAGRRDDSKDDGGRKALGNGVMQMKLPTVYITDYQDVRFCRAMRHRICLGGRKDACGCCEFWGWKNGTCEPGEITSKRDKKRCRDSDETADGRHDGDGDDDNNGGDFADDNWDDDTR